MGDRLTAGDVLIIGVDRHLTMMEGSNLKTSLRRVLPGLADVVLVNGYVGPAIFADKSVLNRPAVDGGDSVAVRWLDSDDDGEGER